MSKFVVGVTGGIGAGKSAVTDIFAEYNIVIVDADIVAREVVEPGSKILAQLADAFGPEILLPDGSLDRAQMRELVFSDEQAKQKLNQIIHPAIRQELLSQLEQADSPYVILAAPLLLENGLEKYVNTVVVVDVPEQLQLSRASQRDTVSKEQIAAIMQSQCSRQQRLDKADYLVDNSGNISELPGKVETLHLQLLALSKQNPNK